MARNRTFSQAIQSQARMWAAGLVTLISTVHCTGPGSAASPPVAFAVVADSGAILDIRVHSSGVRFSDAEVGRLVKLGIEGQLGHQRESNPSLSLESDGPRSMIWHVSGRPGRRARTFVSVQLFEGGRKIGDEYSLMPGPDDPLVRSYLVSTIRTLTFRVLKQSYGATVSSANGTLW
jgi:hypothetical protein